MRNNRNSSRNFFVNFVRFGMLAMCFALVFALVVSGGIFDLGSSSDGVAFAVSKGSANESIAPDSTLSLNSLGFPGVSAGKRSWSQSMTFTQNQYSFDSNVSLATENDSINLDKTYIEAIPSTSNGGYKLQFWNTGNNTVGMVFNYQLPDDVAKLLNNSNYKIRVYGTFAVCKHNAGSGWQSVGYKVFAPRSSFLQASSSEASIVGKGHSDRESAGYLFYSGEDEWKDGANDSTGPRFDVTMTAGNPILSFAVVCGESSSDGWFGGYSSFSFSNLRMNIEISYSPNDTKNTYWWDGASPQNEGFSAANVFPYRTTADAYNWPIQSDAVNSLLGMALDTDVSKLDEYTSRISLRSYTNEKKNENSIDYYKKIGYDIIDYYNYSNAKDPIKGDSIDVNYVSGIKTIQVGDISSIPGEESADGKAAYFELYAISDSTQKTIYVDGVAVGVAIINKTNRARVSLTLYFTENASFRVIVSDYGDGKNTMNFDIAGIDKTAPELLDFNTAEGYFNKLGESDNAFGKWLTTDTSGSVFYINSLYTEDDGLESFSPYLWYYDVKFSGNTPSPEWFVPAGNWGADANQLKNKVPFAASQFEEFSYDFTRGIANGVAPLSTQADGGVAAPTGAGYYLFTFYVLDLAGNINASSVSYYVKVDNVAPENTVTVNAGDIQIVPSSPAEGQLANGSWVNQNITATVAWNMNISGNKISFTYNEADYVVYFRREGNTFKIAKITSTTGNVDWSGGNSYTLKDGETELFTFNFSEIGGKGTFAITFTGYDAAEKAYLLDTTVLFTVLNDGDNDDGETGLSRFDSSWTFGGVGNIAIRIDKVAPADPVLTTDNSEEMTDNKFVNIDFDGNLYVPETRNWFNSAWDVYAFLRLAGDVDVTANELASLQLWVKNYTDIAELEKVNLRVLFETEMLNAEGKSWDYSKTYGVEDILDNNVYIDFKETAGETAGLRVVFVQLTDAAGNKSAVQAFVILVDANVYTLNAEIAEEYLEFIDGIGNVNFRYTNTSGNTQTEFRRGEWSRLEITGLDAKYVPYQIYKDNFNEPQSLMYSNETTTKEFFTEAIREGLLNYVRVNGQNANIIEMAIDRSDSIAALPFGEGYAKLWISFREVVTYEPTSTNVEYTGKETVVPFTVSNEKARDLVKIVWENESVPVTVGTYGLYLELDTTHELSKFYVGDRTDIIAYNIIPGNIIITAHGTSVYGSKINITVDIDKPEGVELTSGMFGVDNPEAFPFVGNYNLKKVEDYEFVNPDDAKNYKITYILGVYTVTPRNLEITFLGATKAYGNVDPKISFSFAKGDYQGSFAGIFSGEGVTYKEDGDRLIVTVPASAVTRERDFNEFGFENAGKYAYKGISTSAIGLNKNFTMSMALSGHGVFEITKRPITVTPVVDQVLYSLDAKVAYKLAEQDAAFAPQLAGLFLAVGDKVGSEGNTYQIALGDLSSIQNFVVSVATGYTVTVVLDDGGNVINLTFKDKELLQILFGDVFDISVLTNLLNYSHSGVGVDFTLKLGAEVVGYDFGADKFTNGAGAYAIRVYVESYKDKTGADVKDKYNFVFKECEYLFVNPATVTVTPVLENNKKIYGDIDNWNFAFTFSGALVDAGYMPESNQVGGKIVRALYRADGTFVQIGGQFDRANDLDGNITAQGHYYGAYVLETLYSSDPNIVLELDKEAFDALRFTVSPRPINVNDAVFTGKDKNNDGTSYVVYKGENEKRTAINIGRLIARITDDVWVDFVANYVDGNGAEQAGQGSWNINFHDFVLKGDDARNYILTGDANVVLTGKFKINGTTVAEITITKNDFSVNKVYDGTSSMTIDDIDIALSSPLCGLNVVFSKGSFGTKDAGVDISVGSITLIVKGVVGIKTQDTDISITDDGKDSTITINNVFATIQPRTIDLDEVILQIPSERNYNGTNEVAIGYMLSGNVLQTGDSIETLGAKFPATVPSKDVQGDKENPEAQNITFGEPTLATGNYAFGFTAVDINAAYADVTLTIIPADISLDITAAGKTYFGSAGLVYGADITVNGIKVNSEPIVGWGDTDNVTVNGQNSATYTLWNQSTDKEDFYVQLGADGNVRLHDLKVTGLDIEITGNPVNYNLTVNDSNEYVFGEIFPLNPVKVSITLNDLSVKDKVYDGTIDAELNDVDLGNYGVTFNQDKDYLSLGYKAQFNTNNPNVQNGADVKISSVKLVSENAGLLASYYIDIASLTGTLKAAGNIVAAPLAVDFDLSKTYDGNVFENVSVNYTLSGYAQTADQSGYSVNFVTGAFDDPNVAKDINGDLTTVSGKVFGFELVRNNGVNNYRLVFASTTDNLQGYIKVAETGSLPATNDQGRPLYYYEFNAATERIVIKEADWNGFTDEEKKTEEGKAVNIVAAYVEGDVKYYVLDGTPTGGMTSTKSLNESGADGIIEPALISYTVNVNPATAERDPFKKVFDDSNATIKADAEGGNGWYYGGRGAEGNDFEFVLGGEYGFEIKDFSVYYESSAVGNGVNVVFRIDSFEIIGGGSIEIGESNNFTLLGGEGYKKAVGTITAKSVDVAFGNVKEDGKVHFTYGDTHEYTYTYTTGGKEIKLAKDADGKTYGYVAVADYTAAGFAATDYTGRRYNINEETGAFELNEEGAYIRIAGTFGDIAPANEASIVNAGEYEVSNVSGKADNFTYAFVAGTVVVDKAALTVGVSNEKLQKEFASSVYPDLAFVISTGELKLSDTEAQILAELKKGAKYFTFTAEGVKGGAVVDRSMISADLEGGAYYALDVEGALQNYDVKLDKTYTLDIVLPELTGLSTASGVFEKTYDGIAVDDANAFAAKYIKGTQSGDTFSLAWAGGTVAKNAGDYNWTITVIRSLGKDATDAKEYTISATISGEYAVLKRNATLTTNEKYDFTYDKTDKKLDESKFVVAGAVNGEDVASAIKVSYKYGDVVTDLMRDAKTYGVVAEITDATMAGNYNLINGIGNVTVKKANITVAVNPESKYQYVTGGTTMNPAHIDFTVPEGFDKADFTVKYTASSTGTVSSVNEPGVYSYTITYVDANYNIVGGIGTLTVAMNEIAFVKDDTVYASIKFTDAVTVPYKLNYNEITEDGSLNSQTYWNFVNDYVVANLGDKKNEATTEGVVAVSLSNGSTEIRRLDQQMTVSVSMPANVASMDGYKAYYVNSDGQLVKISDYEVANGYFTYTTDYIGDLVFVKFAAIALPMWIWILVGILALLIIIAIILAIVISQKRKKMPMYVEAPAAADASEAAADVEIIEYYDPDRPEVVNKNKKPPIIGIRK